jgi:hypothetical protein
MFKVTWKSHEYHPDGRPRSRLPASSVHGWLIKWRGTFSGDEALRTRGMREMREASAIRNRTHNTDGRKMTRSSSPPKPSAPPARAEPARGRSMPPPAKDRPTPTRTRTLPSGSSRGTPSRSATLNKTSPSRKDSMSAGVRSSSTRNSSRPPPSSSSRPQSSSSRQPQPGLKRRATDPSRR